MILSEVDSVSVVTEIGILDKIYSTSCRCWFKTWPGLGDASKSLQGNYAHYLYVHNELCCSNPFDDL